MAEKISQEEAERLKDGPPKESGGPRPEDGLEIFGSDPETLHTSQGPIHIGPMVMRQLKVFIPLAEKFWPSFQASMEKTGDLNLTALMGSDQKLFYEAMAVATGCTPEKLDELQFEEFAAVVTKVLVVNADFFFLTLPKALGRAQASVLVALARTLDKAGVSLSNVSSKTDTASATSEGTPTAK